jgi:hypothetical protein
MSERFWLAVREFANKRVRAAYMAKICHDRQCERCNTWTSEVGGCLKLIDDPADDRYELMTCKRCKHVSRWDCAGMLPICVPSTVLPKP